MVKTSGSPPAAGQSSGSGTGIAARSWTTANSACPPPPTIAITRSPSSKRLAPGAERLDLAGQLEARDVRRGSGRRRIGALALEHVRAVQARGAHPDQELALARLGIRALFDDEIAVLDGDRPHRRGIYCQLSTEV